ncbi:PTS transporter subunit IIC [Salmonella enterica]|uniref:PTS transporter subunit IIC n=1 Tax=Salmonella enterica TaxID=28901 RepID=UPI00376C65C9
MFILETLNFVVDILKVPSVLVGLIALIGLVAQKKAFSDVVKGTIKTILGFIVLGGGATVLVGSLNPLGGMFEHAFNIQGIIPNNEAIVSIALEKYGASTALIMAFGMVANIVVARFTRLKYIFLTGHHTFYMACMIGVILTVAGFEGVGLVGLFLLGQMKLVLILPGVVPHFFTGATAGVFGNATGGRRGAMIGAFANGLLITFLPVLLLPVLGAIGFANTTFSDADFGVIGILLGNLARYLSPMAITGLVVALFALLVAYNVLAKNKKATAEVQENSGAKE